MVFQRMWSKFGSLLLAPLTKMVTGWAGRGKVLVADDTPTSPADTPTDDSDTACPLESPVDAVLTTVTQNADKQPHEPFLYPY